MASREPSNAGRREHAKNLVEKALDAESRGDAETADRHLDEARRIDPEGVIGALQEHEDDGIRRMQVASDAHARPDVAFTIRLNVNGTEHGLQVSACTTLLDALRDRLHLTGTKRGCDLGQCGACTVLVDGRRINACLLLAVMAQGKAIVTIEGIARNGSLHPMQAAFVECDAFQCGYCTPGQIMSAIGLLQEHRDLTDEAIREHMSGNICRCGAYTNIVAAVRDAARQET